MKSTELLEKGKGILSQRGKEYETTTGDGERSFNAIATAFSAITGKSVTPAEAALMLQITKDVRQWSQDRLHEDSVIDCVNYAALKGEELYKQYSDDKEKKTRYVRCIKNVCDLYCHLTKGKIYDILGLEFCSGCNYVYVKDDKGKIKYVELERFEFVSIEE